MIFTEDEPLECEACNELIFPGENYIEYQDHICHDDEDCIKQMLYDIYKDELETKYLVTEPERQADYGDMLYDRWKDGEICRQ